jgi:hypothetical protein
MGTADTKMLVDVMEHADCLIPEISGHCEYATVAGVLTCTTSTDDPMSNKAMLARLDVGSADAAIAEVKAYFAAKHKPFSWIVGPSSAPADLLSHLQVAGFTQALIADGMYLPDLKANIDVVDSVNVRELPVDQPSPTVDIMARGFNMAVETSRQLHKTMAICARSVRTRIYAAYLDDLENPVACAFLAYFPDRPIAILCGGATLQEYRGHGLYKALLARRLADITAEGLRDVIVLADQRTSAPICAKVGFVKVCEMQMYVCRPEK